MGRRAWALLLVVGTFASCSGGHTAAKPPTASVTATTLSAVEREVEAAYLKSWDVYADAMLRLDPSELHVSFADDALRVRSEEVRDLGAGGHRGRMVAEHHISDIHAAGDSAELRDDYVNHSVLLDATTRKPAEADPNHVVHHRYKLRRIEGAWHVVAIVAL